MTVKPIRVLLVDDEDLVRWVVREWLSDDGFEVIEAVSGSEAIGLLLQETFDCCILDLQLKDMSGIDVLKAVKEPAAKLVWLVMTGFLDEGTYHELKRFGIAGGAILTKPILDMKVISSTIRGLLEV